MSGVDPELLGVLGHEEGLAQLQLVDPLFFQSQLVQHPLFLVLQLVKRRDCGPVQLFLMAGPQRVRPLFFLVAGLLLAGQAHVDVV